MRKGQRNYDEQARMRHTDMDEWNMWTRHGSGGGHKKPPKEKTLKKNNDTQNEKLFEGKNLTASGGSETQGPARE